MFCVSTLTSRMVVQILGYIENLGRSVTGARLQSFWLGRAVPVLAVGLFALKLILNFPLMAAPTLSGVSAVLRGVGAEALSWRIFEAEPKRKHIVYVGFTVVFACALQDQLSTVVAMVGAVVTLPLILLFPIFFYVKLCHVSRWEMAVIVVEMVISVAVVLSNIATQLRG